MKAFWKGFTTLDVIKNISDSWQRGENININRSLGKVGSNPHGWIWRVQHFCGGITVDMVEIATEPELEVEPEDVTELLQHHDQMLLNEELLLMDKKIVDFWGGIYSGEDCLNDRNDLEYYINSVDKAVAGFEKIDSNIERSCIVSKILSNKIVHYREIGCKRVNYLKNKK